SFSGTIASASSRALVRARYSSPSISVTARAFPEVASSISSAMSATAKLPGTQQEALELQPAVAVLTQRLDHVGAERRLSERRARPGPGRRPPALLRGAGGSPAPPPAPGRAARERTATGWWEATHRGSR